MNCLFVFSWIAVISTVNTRECYVECPTRETNTICGLNLGNNTYTLFPNKCAYDLYVICNDDVDIVQTPIKYCIRSSRRYDEEDLCPVFCPSHYRPACGASKLRSFVYKSFTNKCHMDMINCRGDEESSGYVEVPLEFCQRHAMKNIFKEKFVVSHLNDFRDYF